MNTARDLIVDELRTAKERAAALLQEAHGVRLRLLTATQFARLDQLAELTGTERADELAAAHDRLAELARDARTLDERIRALSAQLRGARA